MGTLGVELSFKGRPKIETNIMGKMKNEWEVLDKGLEQTNAF